MFKKTNTAQKQQPKANPFPWIQLVKKDPLDELLVNVRDKGTVYSCFHKEIRNLTGYERCSKNEISDFKKRCEKHNIAIITELEKDQNQKIFLLHNRSHLYKSLQLHFKKETLKP